jgi:hypothetical protein
LAVPGTTLGVYWRFSVLARTIGGAARHSPERFLGGPNLSVCPPPAEHKGPETSPRVRLAGFSFGALWLQKYACHVAAYWALISN